MKIVHLDIEKLIENMDDKTYELSKCESMEELEETFLSHVFECVGKGEL